MPCITSTITARTSDILSCFGLALASDPYSQSAPLQESSSRSSTLKLVILLAQVFLRLQGYALQPRYSPYNPALSPVPPNIHYSLLPPTR
jgi:hypothetical protein